MRKPIAAFVAIGDSIYTPPCPGGRGYKILFLVWSKTQTLRTQMAAAAGVQEFGFLVTLLSSLEVEMHMMAQMKAYDDTNVCIIFGIFTNRCCIPLGIIFLRK